MNPDLGRCWRHPTLPVVMHGSGQVATTDEPAREEHYIAQRDTFARIGKERWRGEPMSREEYNAHCGPTGTHFVGSPEQRVESLRRSGTGVVPRVREVLTGQGFHPSG